MQSNDNHLPDCRRGQFLVVINTNMYVFVLAESIEIFASHGKLIWSGRIFDHTPRLSYEFHNYFLVAGRSQRTISELQRYSSYRVLQSS